MSNTYFEKLKDPRWQKLRLKIYERDNFMCQYCGETKVTLNIHHISYTGNPWEADDKLLVTLCEDCHSLETENLKVIELKIIKDLKSKGFNSSHFRLLNKLMNNMPFIHHNDVQLTALEWFLNEENIREIITKFFNDFRSK